MDLIGFSHSLSKYLCSLFLSCFPILQICSVAMFASDDILGRVDIDLSDVQFTTRTFNAETMD